MADVSLRYLLYGEDKTASKAVKKVGEDAESTASKLSGAIGRMGSVVGGEVGDLLDRAAQGMSALDGRGDRLGKRLVMVGSVAAGAGLAMQQMAAGDVEAQNRLEAAINATGKSVDDYADSVDSLVSAQVKWGNTDGDVKNALTKLVDAYRDPTKALERMQLATDLAAAKTISLGEAASLVGRAHNGSARVFREFGVEVEKNADGTGNYEKALDELAAQLSGRAAASQDSFAGKVREGKAWLDNAASALAETYGPAVTAAGSAVTALGVVLDIVKARSGASAAATTTEAAATAGSTASRVAHAVASRAAAAAAWTFNAAVSATPIGILLAAVTAISFWAKAQNDAKQAADDLAATLEKTTGAFTQASREWAAAKLLKDVDPEDFKRLSETLNVTVADIVDAAALGGDAITQLKDRIVAADPSGGWEAKPLLNAIDALARDSDRARLAQEQLRPVVAATGEASNATAGQVEKLDKAQKSAADAADELRAAQGRLRDNLLDVREAERGFADAIDSLSASIDKNGRSLDIHTEKGRNNEAALDRVRDAAVKATEASLKQGGSVEKAAAVMDAKRTSFVEQATRLLGNEKAAQQLADQLGLTRGKVDELAAAVRATPDGKAITIVAETSEAMARISAMRSALNSVAGQVAISAKLSAMDKPYGALAGGGPAYAGRMYLVGERGPELVKMGASGTVVPADQTAAALAGGAPSVRVFIGNEELTDRMRTVVDDASSAAARSLMAGV